MPSLSLRPRRMSQRGAVLNQRLLSLPVLDRSLAPSFRVIICLAAIRETSGFWNDAEQEKPLK